MKKNIIIKNKDSGVIELYFKNILDLDDKEFKNLTDKLSDINQFKNENGDGVFYKQSTDTDPLTFEKMFYEKSTNTHPVAFEKKSLIEIITKYRKTRDPEDSEHESLLSTFALFSKDGLEALAYASFFFYPEGPNDKPNHFLEPDLIFFNEIRGQGISRPIIACLMTDIFQKIIADERLNEYGGILLTVHPENSSSRGILKNIGFDYKKITDESPSEHRVTEAIELDPLSATVIKLSQETQTDSDSAFQYLLDSDIIENSFLIKIGEDLGIRLTATNKDRPLKLFEKIKTILENYTDYQGGINFLTEQIGKLARESNIADFTPQAIKNINEKSSQTCFTQEPSPDEAPALTTSPMATHLTSEGRGK